MICDNLNFQYRKDFVTRIKEDDFWIVPDRGLETVWSDVMGEEVSMRELRKVAGHPGPGYYEPNQGVIHNFFRRNDLSLDVATKLGAPTEQIRQGEHEAADEERPAMESDSDEVLTDPESAARNAREASDDEDDSSVEHELG